MLTLTAGSTAVMDCVVVVLDCTVEEGNELEMTLGSVVWELRL